jgi:hypothetical protein
VLGAGVACDGIAAKAVLQTPLEHDNAGGMNGNFNWLFVANPSMPTPMPCPSAAYCPAWTCSTDKGPR